MRINILQTIVAVIALVWASSTARAVELGQSVVALKAELGEPLGVMQKSGRQAYVYDGGTIEVSEGRVVEIDPGFARRAERRKEERLLDAEMQRKGHVKYQGQWMTSAAARTLKAAQESRARASQGVHKGTSITKISNRGAKVDVTEMLVKGKITIVDFYADWCGPCRRISPALEKLALKDDGIHLTKIDIVRWSTPVTKQFSISSVPNIRVFDRSGNQVGLPTSSMAMVKSLVKKAQ